MNETCKNCKWSKINKVAFSAPYDHEPPLIVDDYHCHKGSPSFGYPDGTCMGAMTEAIWPKVREDYGCGKFKLKEAE